MIVESPYRKLVRPLVRYLEFSARQNRDDLIVVILPEYVARHRWERLLFNENARRIRDELLGHPNILVAQVPSGAISERDGDQGRAGPPALRYPPDRARSCSARCLVGRR